MPEYRIEFQIQRRREGEDDFTEIGFGSSTASNDLDACTHWINSAVTNGEWETEPGQPDPDDILTEIQEARPRPGESGRADRRREAVDLLAALQRSLAAATAEREEEVPVDER